MKVIAIIALVFAVVAVVGLARIAWRFLYQNEPIESGGSDGRQFFGRR